MDDSSSSLVPSSQAEALRIGAKFYFTGRPCKNGHIANKYACNKTCVTCYSAIRKAKYQANKDKEKASVRAWRERNKELVGNYAKQYFADNKESRIANLRSWQKRNAAHCAKMASMYRAKKRIAEPSWNNEFDNFVFDEAFSLAANRGSITGIKWDVDHMVPIASKTACGLHTGMNIQVIPSSLNQKKSNKMILTEPGQWINAL